ncbi:MAG: hypothetical protein R3358_11960 [Woeseiaceae bacterium]|nr:hypothetical protein [Woeseiaceae bacterium]
MRRLAALLAATLLTACGQEPGPEPTKDTDAAATEAVATATPASILPAAEPRKIGCGDDGALTATLYGALSGDVSWQADNMYCEGMPRPNDAGARLRFAGKAGDPALAIAFIVAIPALERGATATELPSVVTVIEEGKGRFFSTPDLDSCWTDVKAHEALDESDGTFAIDGELYCISPVPEVNGDTSVSIEEMRFSGLVDWGSS